LDKREQIIKNIQQPRIISLWFMSGPVVLYMTLRGVS